MSHISRRALVAGATAAAVAGPLVTNAPARAAAPLSGKQAPGFYRYKVGEFEVTVITDGVRPSPLADNFVRNAPKDAVMAAIASAYPGQDPAQPVFPFTPSVVNTGSKLVVIDTGMGPATFAQSKGALGQFQTNLAAAGFDRNAVDVVIISHFHADHIGGLLNEEGKPAYPNAEVMVPEPEWAHWMDDAKMNAAPEGARGGFQNARRIFGALGKQPTRYAPNKEIVPGISAVASPGHTPGHTSHVVASGNGRVLIQADITAGPSYLFIRNPQWQAAFDTDGALAEQTRRKLYDMAVAEKMMVQGFHFPFPAIGYVEKDGNGYRFTPASWNPTI